MTKDISIDPIPDDTLSEVAHALGKSFAEQPLAKDANLLLRACHIIFCHLNISVKKISIIQSSSILEQLKNIVEQYSLRFRKIILDSDWWKKDNGPLLLFDKHDLPFALLPDDNGNYKIINPADESSIKLTDVSAKRFVAIGYMFYRSLPDYSLNITDIFKFSFKHRISSFMRIFTQQMIIVVLGLFVPVVTGIIMSQVIPNASYNLLTQFLLALCFNIIIISLFRISNYLVILRLRLKMDAALQPAIFDRLLKLDTAFFKSFTSGDLVNRANGFDTIQQELNFSIFVSLLNAIVSLLSLIFMAFYDVILTFIAALFALILVLIVFSFCLQQLYYQSKIVNEQGRLTGLLLQFIMGISKLKITHTEKNAFQEWCHGFSYKINMEYRSGIISTYLAVFSGSFALLTTMILFMGVYWRGTSLSFGNFIAFNGLYTQFFASLLQIIGALTILLRTITTLERIKPILQTETEVRKPESVILLDGQIEMRQVSFNYEHSKKEIFNNFSMLVQPGESVVLSGPSGSGKSTLFRLLLGLEKPEGGTILYNNIDLLTLDNNCVRKQIGVVLQQTFLLPGSILENILGGNDTLTIEDAWRAAEIADIASEIAKMPMGMQTYVSENGRTLSKGQCQRVLIARAIIHQPKILFLDEATSAIDNSSHNKIMQTLTSMPMTLIIATHRYNTLTENRHVHFTHQCHLS